MQIFSHHRSHSRIEDGQQSSVIAVCRSFKFVSKLSIYLKAQLSLMLLIVLILDPGPLRDGAEQICLVWDLVVALWGKLTEDDDDDDDDSKFLFAITSRSFF